MYVFYPIISRLITSFRQLMFQRKKELLQKNAAIERTRTSNPECFSPELVQTCKNELSKCVSTNNIKSIANDTFNFGNSNPREYSVSKSLSGTNIHMNGSQHITEPSSSSASGISSPSNNSNNSNKEDDEKYVLNYLKKN